LKKSLRIEVVVTTTVEECTVNLVRSTFGDKRDLRAEDRPWLALALAVGHPELLNRLGVQPQHRRRQRVGLRFIDVDSVERDVRLVRSRAPAT
jgi:hypothetical protein